jgi:hypothetical protein
LGSPLFKKSSNGGFLSGGYFTLQEYNSGVTGVEISDPSKEVFNRLKNIKGEIELTEEFFTTEEK